MQSELHSQTAQNFCNTANQLKSQGKLNEAIANYQKALEIQPDFVEVHHQLGEVYFQERKFPEATASCKLALKLQPNFAPAYKTLGNILQAQSRIEEALRAYNKALEIDPEFVEALVNKGTMISKLGQSEDAIACYRNAIELKPDMAAAHWNLGNLLIQLGRTDEGISCWQKASESDPEKFNYQFFQNLAINFGQAGNIDASIGCYQQAIALKPDYTLAYLNLGTLLQRQNRLEDAIAIYQKSLEIQPDSLVYQALGNALKQQGNIDSAINYWQKALELQPDAIAAETYNDLGTALAEKGELENAIEYYQKAIQLKSDYPLAHLNLGILLQRQNKIEESIPHFHKTIELQPDAEEAYKYIGNTLIKQERLHEALAYYQKSLKLNSKSAETYFHIGSILAQQEKFAEAITYFQKAIDLQPDFAEAYCNISMALVRQGQKQDYFKVEQFQEAINQLQKALEVKPNLLLVHLCMGQLITAPVKNSNFAVLREAADRYLLNCGEKGQLIAAITYMSIYVKSGLTQIAKENFLAIEQKIYQRLSELAAEEIALIYTQVLFNINYLRDELAANSKLAKVVAKEYVEKILNNNENQNYNIKLKSRPNKKLRIGFLSSFFLRHSVGWCSYDIIRELSKLTPNIFLYVTGERKPDDRTKLFEAVAEKLYKPQKLPNGTANAKEIIDEISKDDLDILIDLDSITVPVQVEIIHRKPAPVCLTWLGFEAPYTNEQNYFLSDWHTHPTGREEYNREQLIRMPNSFVAVSGFECKPVERTSARKALRIAEDQVTYLCVAPAYKLNPELIKAQVKILKEVPDSVLIHKAHTGDPEVIKATYRQECEAIGVGFHRIKFMSLVNTEEDHRTTYKIADVLLDSYPYNGGTHNLEALWFNLPVVTRCGEQYLSRMGYSFLQTLSIQAGIANSWEEYTNWGIELGKNTDLRLSIRSQLEQSKQPETLSPLWNPKKFAEDMYAVFEELLAKKANAAND